MNIFRRHAAIAVLLLSSVLISGCVGTAIEAATDATLAVAKAPFKVGGAVIDVIDGDDD